MRMSPDRGDKMTGYQWLYELMGSIMGEAGALRPHFMFLLPWIMVLSQTMVIFLLFLDSQETRYRPTVPHCDPSACSRYCHKHSAGGVPPPSLKPVDTQLAPVSNNGTSSLHMFFNRVPKCGTSGLIDIIIHSAQRNNFTFIRDPQYMKFWLNKQEQYQLAAWFTQVPQQLLFERHLHFLDFDSYGLVQPLYINILRDPLERLVSWYYFRRYQTGHIRIMPTIQRVRTFDECVIGNHTECMEPHGDHPEEGWFKVIPFFCGQEPICRVPGEAALVRAIRNVKKFYLVVGVTEQYEQFIRVLEHLQPAYFKGATNFYKTNEKLLREKHRTTYKLPPSAEVSVYMKNKMLLEYKFYNFVKKRFENMYKTITAKQSL